MTPDFELPMIQADFMDAMDATAPAHVHVEALMVLSHLNA
jgi:hypothetical protein